MKGLFKMLGLTPAQEQSEHLCGSVLTMRVDERGIPREILIDGRYLEHIAHCELNIACGRMAQAKLIVNVKEVRTESYVTPPAPPAANPVDESQQPCGMAYHVIGDPENQIRSCYLRKGHPGPCLSA